MRRLVAKKWNAPSKATLAAPPDSSANAVNRPKYHGRRQARHLERLRFCDAHPSIVANRAPELMRPEKAPESGSPPQTRTELQAWIRGHLHLPAPLENALIA